MRTVTHLGMTAAAFFALCELGVAADLPARQAPPAFVPPPIFTWTGFYVGVVAGAVDQSAGIVTTIDPGTHLAIPANTSAVAASGTFSPRGRTGFLAGGEVGYNYQIGSLVLGVEGDAQYIDVKRSFAGSGLFTTGDTFSIRSSVGESVFGTVRGRVGFAVDHLLFFATGGVAFTDRNLRQTYSDTLDATRGALSASGTNVGYAVGGGVEYAFTANWSLKAEYLYASFDRIAGNYTITSQTGGTNALHVSSGRQDLQIGRVGLNYRF